MLIWDIFAILQLCFEAIRWTADGLVRIQNETLRRFGTGDGLPSTSILGLVALNDGGLLVLTPAGQVERLDVIENAVTG